MTPPVICVLNGPHLDRLGERDPAVYGSATLDDVRAMCEERAATLGASIEFTQSDDVTVLCAALERTDVDAFVVNPAAFTHLSFSLRRAVAACRAPVVEVHISNIHRREAYRRTSLLAGVADGSVVGLGVTGYVLAVEAAFGLIRNGSKGAT